VVLERRKNVAERYLRGQTQWEIARAFEVDQSQVSRDLAWARKQWVASTVCKIDEHKARELAKVDALERTYWEAWVESKQPKETTESGKTDKHTRVSLKREQRDGNPAFLAGVQWCIDKRCEILGLNAPVKNLNMNADLLKLFDELAARKGRKRGEPHPIDAKIESVGKQLPKPEENAEM